MSRGCSAAARLRGPHRADTGEGNGPSPRSATPWPPSTSMSGAHYNEHALSAGGDAPAASYLNAPSALCVLMGVNRLLHRHVHLRAVVSAVNRASRL